MEETNLPIEGETMSTTITVPRLGVGAVILNDKKEILLVLRKFRGRRGDWRHALVFARCTSVESGLLRRTSYRAFAKPEPFIKSKTDSCPCGLSVFFVKKLSFLFG